MDWLKSIAPMIGTALSGPLGGAAAAFVADKLGLESKTVNAVKDMLQSGQMTGDQIAAIKLAEIDFQKFLKDNNIRIEEVHAADRADARKMHASIRSPMPAVLSVFVTVGYFAVLIGMMTDVLNVKESQALLIMLGSLGTAWGMVMAFWFGTTRSSSEKTELLSKAGPIR